MSQMVEQVAIAMAGGTERWDILSEGSSKFGEDGLFKEDYRGLARDGIKAMREPTGVMVAVEVDITRPGNDETNSDYELAPEEVRKVWQAMIDAALK